MTGRDTDVAARHNARVLACAQVLGGANPAIVVSLGGLVGQGLASSSELATLPVSMLQVGLALGTIPAAALMRGLGRRGGYFVGALVGTAAGCIAAYGAASASFLVFCLGTVLAGFYASFVQSYRFAAADLASPAFRPRAISWVMVGGIAAAFVGPQTVIWTQALWPEAGFAAGFIGQAGLAVTSIAVLAFLRPGPAPIVTVSPAIGRPLSEIVRQPRFVLAVLTGLVSYGLMSFVMTAAPLAMVVECGLPVGAATLGIQWHILAMYGPSFVTGRIIARFGAERVALAGLVMIAFAAMVGLAGTDVPHFWTALVLVGIGWNLGFIGATSLVTQCYRPEERTKVQAANDFLVFGSVAIASLSSGKLLSVGGWAAVNWLVLPTVAVVATLLVIGTRYTRPAVTASS